MSWGVRGWPVTGWLLGRLKVDGGTVNRSLPVLRLKQRWANAALAFTGLSVEIDDTGSTSGSLGVNVLVNNVTVASVRKDGTIFTNSTLQVRDGQGLTNGSLASATLSDNSDSLFGRTDRHHIRIFPNSSFEIGYIAMFHSATRLYTMYADAANVWALRNSTSAQSARVYNTYTSLTNYERANLTWSSNILQFGTEKGSGGGTARSLEIQTDATTRAQVDATTGTWRNTRTVAAVAASATLTIAQLQGGIITSTTAAPVTGTLPTGTLSDAGFAANTTNLTFEWSVINTGANVFTVQAGTDHTLTGSGAVAAGASGLFATRRSAANTYITYRLA